MSRYAPVYAPLAANQPASPVNVSQDPHRCLVTGAECPPWRFPPPCRRPSLPRARSGDGTSRAEAPPPRHSSPLVFRCCLLVRVTLVSVAPVPVSPLASKCVTEHSINHPLFQLASRQILLSAAAAGNWPRCFALFNLSGLSRYYIPSAAAAAALSV